MAVAGGVWGITSLVHSFQGGAYSCLPSDFPRYPGSTVSSETTSVRANGHECRMTFESNADIDTVGPYFESHLKSGDWTVGSVDYSAGTITFSRVTRPQVSGTAKLSPLQHGTRIAIVLDS